MIKNCTTFPFALSPLPFRLCPFPFALSLLAIFCTVPKSSPKNNGWVDLFDGKSLSGWRAGENPSTFRVEDGTIVVHGQRAHLFYEGPYMNHDFTNFELECTVMTTPGSNSGIFFHTAFQERGWPSKGYEVQVNNSHSDWRRTGSLYAVDDVKEVFVKDNEWFTESIIVNGKNIVIRINDRVVVNYTEPDDVEKLAGRSQKRLSSGTFALQGARSAKQSFLQVSKSTRYKIISSLVVIIQSEKRRKGR